MKRYDYLLVGAGLFNAVFAHNATKKGKTCLVVEKRDHIAGNIYTYCHNGIHVHKYGAHIFHTSNKTVWDFVNQFATFNRFTNSPVANYKGKLYNLPFNMNTFYQMWGVINPDKAKEKIAQQVKESGIVEPKNLEEQAISLVGKDIYQTLVKDYTEKQWGQECTKLPSFIIRRLPLRFTFDNNYFNDTYQGIPVGGYTQMVEKMFAGCDVKLNCDYFDHKEELDSICDKVLFSGQIDKYFDYCYGALEYRSLRFETDFLDVDNYQGNAVVNYTDKETPYTRIIEHKHFDTQQGQVGTVVTREYSKTWKMGDEPYYPVNNDRNNQLYQKYAEKAKMQNVLFVGRLGEYKYYDMHLVIERALNVSKEILGE